MASNDATVRLWDVNTGQLLSTLRDVGNTLAVAFAPDGSRLAWTNEDGSIKLWDPPRGELVRTIRGEADQLRCLAFTPDGRNVVAAGKGKVIRIWDVDTGQELLTLEETRGPDQLPGIHTRWLDPCLVQPRWGRPALVPGPIRPVPAP